MTHKTTIHILSLFMALTALLWTGCNSDDLFLSNDLGSRLESEGEYRLSSFTLKPGVWEIPDGTTSLRIQLQSHTDNSLTEYKATVQQNESNPQFTLYIPKGEKIIDSDYDLTACLMDGTWLRTRLKVMFQEEMLHTLMASSVKYALEKGIGTAEDPYQINTMDDFSEFELALSNDSVTHAAGLYFRQTGDFDAPRRSNIYEGRYYAAFPFAGNYNGDGHTITLSYIGSKGEEDRDIGLFQTLHHGAQVRNLILRPNIQGVQKNGGAVAGSSNGTVVLTNITVEGNLTDCGTNIGGLIGYATDNLTVNQCKLYATLSGIDFVGGAIGRMEQGKLKVNDFSNLEMKPNSSPTTHLFSIHASNRGAGGVAGILTNNSSFEINNVTLKHSISDQESDVRIIYAGVDRAGGIIGEAVIQNNSSIKAVKILAPVRSDQKDVGGLIGSATLSADLNLQNCSVASLVRGKENVGGFFGNLKSDNHLILDGPSRGNRIAQVENGYLAVQGAKNVGGLFGNLSGDIQANAISLINVNVKATDNFAGGVIGHQYENILRGEFFSLDANMSVWGQDAVGGLVGYAEHSTINGGMEAINLSTIPLPDSFKSNFAGKIADANGNATGTSMGGIVGYAKNTTLRYLCATGSVYGKERVGGIVGHVNNRTRGEVTSCVSKANVVKNSQGDATGGVIGKLQFLAGGYHHLLNYAKVEGNTNVGGIIRIVECDVTDMKFDLNNCVNTASVDGTADVGGVVGRLIPSSSTPTKNSQLSYCANYGTISSVSGNLGGIIGRGSSKRMRVLNSANHGQIEGGSQVKYVGGIAGSLGVDADYTRQDSNMEMAFCCNRGTIAADNSGAFVGGLLGYQEEGELLNDSKWITHDCYNMGTVTSNQSSDNGGVIGCVDHTAEVRRCINVGKVSYGNGVVGTHKSGSVWYHYDLYYLENSGGGWSASSFKESNKKTSSTFSHFDFSNVWVTDNNNAMNNGYPYLIDCPYQSLYYKAP